MSFKHANLKGLLLGFLCTFAATALGQSLLELPVKVKEDRSPISIFIELENDHPIRFFYLDEWLKYYSISTAQDGKKLKDVLDQIATEANLSYTVLFDYAIVFTKDPAAAMQRENLLKAASAAKKNIRSVVFGKKEIDYRPNKKVVVSGVITSEQNNEPLAGAIVYLNDLNQTFTTDAAGRFSLNMSSGDHVVTFQHQNFSDQVIDLRAYSSGTLDIVMEEAPTVLQEVVINDQAIITSRAGQSSLSIKTLKRGPTFLGESDIIKNLQVQPGVTSVGEVSAGFNVRGGGSDQNLVLYDGVPIFNTAHALGFFSGFNAEAVGNVTFYRGGIPAEYGGRASSVLNITSKEGDYRKWTATGGIGIISSNVAIGGPIKRDTTSVIASFRTSYSNWILNSVRSNYADVGKSSLAFMDGSLKLAHKLNANTKIQLSTYGSRDEFSLATDTLYGWQNLSGSLRIDKIISQRLFSTVTLGVGNYGYNFSDKDADNAFKMNYGVTYPSLNIDFNLNGTHSWSFGLQTTYYNFRPGHLRPTTATSSQDEIKVADENSIESALYVSDGFNIADNLFAELGVRFSMFNRIGAGVTYQYQSGASIDARNTIDSVVYDRGEVMKTYFGFEPRVAFRYTLDANTSIKVGYNRINQYLHLVTNTAAITPVDIWQSSNEFFKPQIADQVSAGVFRTVKENMYEVSIEGYYKNIQNALDFKDGASLLLNRKIETALLPGKAIAYGVELAVNKVKGRLQGLANYTYSRSLRQVNGLRSNEKINNGEFYASNYDQPHVANVSWRYGISRRHFFSGNFTYHTGRPMSVPEAGYIIDNNVVSAFSERNKYRIPDYHRLDLALVIEGNHKRKKILDGTWTISFYNVYARKNAYSVFYKEDHELHRLVPYKLTVIGTVIPSLSYGFKF